MENLLKNSIVETLFKGYISIMKAVSAKEFFKRELTTVERVGADNIEGLKNSVLKLGRYDESDPTKSYVTRFFHLEGMVWFLWKKEGVITINELDAKSEHTSDTFRFGYIVIKYIRCSSRYISIF